MKRLALVTIFLLSFSANAAAQNDQQDYPLAPNWALTSSTGETVRLSRVVREQPVVILFWASWCPYCKALMPHLQSIELEYGDRIEILAVNFRDKGDAVQFVEQAGYNFTVLPGGDEVAKLYDVWGTPGVLVVDQEQRIRFDLRDLAPFQPEKIDAIDSNSRKAGLKAPYWAAHIRKAIAAVPARETKPEVEKAQ